MGKKFNSRLTAPSTTDKHWISTNNGGLNECIHIAGGSVLPNCVGYAWGRFYELTGVRPKLSKGNAENWYANTADGYKRSQTPVLGAVACWRKGQAFNETDGCGHVAIVEEIKPNGNIVCSNSAYGGTRFYVKEYSKNAGYNCGALTFQGFILPPVNFELPDAASTAKKSVDEIAAEVIRGEWGAGQERRDRLTAAGYSHDEVQKRVNEKLNGDKSPASKPQKSVDEIAAEVIRGEWGAGQERKDKLTVAGYDYDEVHKRVNEKLNGDKTPTSKLQKSVDEIAAEVIRGEWGAGKEHKDRLTAAGYDYDEVHKRVNEMLNGDKTPTSKPQKSVDEIAAEVIRGEWGAGKERKDRLTAAGYNYDDVQRRVNQMIYK